MTALTAARAAHNPNGTQPTSTIASKGPSSAHNEEYRWSVVDGKDVMPSAVAGFLDWLLTYPRVPETQVEYAESIGVHQRTVRKWKTDPRVIREWEVRAKSLNVGVERVQAVLDNLYRIATTRQDAAGVTAANQYMQMVDRFTPKNTVVVQDSSIDGMTNAELAALAGLID